jgi:hypothetical protein
MKTRFLKRSKSIQLNSKSLNNIFMCLKKGSSFDEVQENFLFETELTEEDLNTPIIIPEHKKFKRTINQYDSFKCLFLFFDKNKKDEYIIPYLGIDT